MCRFIPGWYSSFITLLIYKDIPAEQSGEYFGLMDICGKGAAFLGTASVSLVSQLTGSISAGVGSIAIFFVLGIFFFIKTIKTN